MKTVRTNDGSSTFFNEEFEEHYHSTSGALQEALEKFVKPANLERKAKEGKVVILDVCFGLGYNSAMAIDYILSINPTCSIVVFGLENDYHIIKSILDVEVELSSYKIMKKVAKKILDNKDTQEISYTRDDIQIYMFMGDARKTIKKVHENVDVVFLDPFSPKVCPQLWSETFIAQIVGKMKTTSVLTTYSCARVVRDNLKKTGLVVSDGPCVGRRAPSTIAIKNF